MEDPHAPDAVRGKFALVRKELSAALIERDDEIDLVLTALLAGEHVLLVGPPGCGKSLLLDAVLKWTGGSRFSILLTKFTTPEELVGPVSLAALKEDKFLRVTAGKLPEADACFLDEVFKGSSAILNTLLRVLNEGTSTAATASPVRCRSSCVSRRRTRGRRPTPGRNWPPCSTASCSANRSPRFARKPAGRR